MSTTEATVKKCSRCGTVIESCAFCDDPDCAAIICYRCVAVLLYERPPSKRESSPTETARA